MGDGRQELTLAPATGTSQNRRAECEAASQQRILDTPRTREACKRLGLVLEDLQWRSVDAFAHFSDSREKAQLRYEHFEKRRKDHLAEVLAERARVIAQNAKKGDVPGVQSAQFLGLLESLFDREAKRLEVDLKGQLRQHGSLVKDNETQLKKEMGQQQRDEVREQRRALSRQYFAGNGNRARQKLDDRMAHNAELMAKQDEMFRDKQASHSNQLAAEEERMKRFKEDKHALLGDRFAVGKDRLERAKEKNMMQHLENRMKGEVLLAEKDDRCSQVHARREDENKRRQIMGEEHHLHILDVRETKNRIDRIENNRRGEIREQLDNDVERIETLMALKDSLLDQRRGRNMKAEATKAARGLSLRRDFLPGPGQYEAQPSCLTEVSGGRMGKAKALGMVDDAVKGYSQTPAPGSYSTSLLPNGDRIDKSCPDGGKFKDHDRDTFLDAAVKAKDFVPAPGRYESKSQLDRRGTEMRRDKIGEVVSAERKRCPRSETPGPASYNVDDYSRKEVLRRAQRSLPNLTRDMLRMNNRVAAH